MNLINKKEILQSIRIDTAVNYMDKGNQNIGVSTRKVMTDSTTYSSKYLSTYVCMLSPPYFYKKKKQSW